MKTRRVSQSFRREEVNILLNALRNYTGKRDEDFNSIYGKVIRMKQKSDLIEIKKEQERGKDEVLRDEEAPRRYAEPGVYRV